MYDEIFKKFSDRALRNVFGKEISSYKTGGVIDVLVFPENMEEINWLFKFLIERKIDYFICGKITNVLISDDGFRGVFIKTDRLNKIEFRDNIIIVESGFLWDKMIELAIERGLGGLEKTSYIPGSVGGAVRMNAGAFGQETFDRLISITVFDIKNSMVKKMGKNELNYGYRKVEGIEDFFIISQEFAFIPEDPSKLKMIRDDIIRKRIEKQPLEFPSAGSVFKRPKNDYASRLIDVCGLKGLRIGGAEVSLKHAGFIINRGDATSTDIYNLINKVKDEVYKKTGVNLELEQILVGRF